MVAARESTGFRPVVVLGAARAGTNILRDVLTASPAMTTWPCDEINYIWRHGNARVPHDELTADHARPRVVRYIRRAFAAQARRGGAPVVVEKTCASTLRVPFVDIVLPDATYVVIERDPVDAVASAMKRWRAPLETNYLAAKARFVPPTDLPYYALRYLGHRVAKLRSDDDVLPSWGPRFAGIDDLVASEPLHVVCAHQWARSVAACRRGLEQVSGDRVLRVEYEGLAREPARVVGELTNELLGRRDPSAVVASRAISAGSVGRGRHRLSPRDIADIESVVANVLLR